MDIETLEKALETGRKRGGGPAVEFKALQDIMTMLAYRNRAQLREDDYTAIYNWYVDHLLKLYQQMIEQKNRQGVGYQIKAVQNDGLLSAICRIEALLAAIPEITVAEAVAG